MGGWGGGSSIDVLLKHTSENSAPIIIHTGPQPGQGVEPDSKTERDRQ